MADKNTINPITGLVEGVGRRSTLSAGIPELTGRQTSITEYEGIDPLSTYLRYGVNAVPFLDMDEERAQRQPFKEKLGRGVAKFLGKTATAVAGATIGSLYGLGDSFATGEFGSFFDNDFQEHLDDWNEKMDDNLAHYYTKAEQDASFFQSLGSANFWLNDVSGALSFTAGAILSELILTAATGLSAGAASPIQAAQTAKLLATAKQLMKGVNQAKKMKRGERAVNTLRQVITGAGYESGVEARHFRDQAMEAFRVEHPDASAEDLGMAADFINKQANAVFAANLALVGWSNAEQFKSIFGPGLRTQAKVGFTKGIKQEAGDLLTGKFGAAYKTGSKAANKLDRIVDVGWRVVKNPIAEGIVEEGGQSVISNTALNYLQNSYSSDGTKASAGMIDAITQALGETYGTKEGQKEIGIGMLVGAMSMPTFRAAPWKKEGWAGGIAEAIFEYKGAKKEQEHLAWRNTKRTYDNIREQIKANNQMYTGNEAIGDAIEEGRLFEAKNAEADKTFGFLAARYDAGMMGDTVDAYVSKVENMSIDEFTAEFGYQNATEEELAKRKSQVIQSFKEKAKAVDSAMSDAEVFEPSEDYSDDNAQNFKTALAHLIYRIKDSGIREENLSSEITSIAQGIDPNKLKTFVDYKHKMAAQKGSVTKARKSLDQAEEEYDALVSTLAEEKETHPKLSKLRKKLDELRSQTGGKPTPEQSVEMQNLGWEINRVRLEMEDIHQKKIDQAKKDKSITYEKWNTAQKKLDALREKRNTEAKAEAERLKTIEKEFNKNIEDFDNVAEAMDAYGKEIKSLVEALDPSDAQKVARLVGDLAALRAQKVELVNNYNWMFTPEGQKTFKDVNDKLIKNYAYASAELRREGAIIRGVKPEAVTQKQKAADIAKNKTKLDNVTDEEFKKDWDQYNAEIGDSSKTEAEQLAILDTWKKAFENKAKKYTGEKQNNYADAADDAQFRIDNIKSSQAAKKKKDDNLKASVLDTVVHEYRYFNRLQTENQPAELKAFLSSLSYGDMKDNAMLSVDDYDGDGYGKINDHNSKVSSVNGHVKLDGKAVHLWYKTDKKMNVPPQFVRTDEKGNTWYRLGYMPDPRRFLDSKGNELNLDHTTKEGIANLQALNNKFVSDDGKPTTDGAWFLARYNKMKEIFDKNLAKDGDSVMVGSMGTVVMTFGFKKLLDNKPAVDEFFQGDEYELSIPDVGTGIFIVERDSLTNPAMHTPKNNMWIREAGVWRQLDLVEAAAVKKWIETDKSMQWNSAKNKFHIPKAGQYAVIATHQRRLPGKETKYKREPMVYDLGQPNLEDMVDREATWDSIMKQVKEVEDTPGAVKSGVEVLDHEGRPLFVTLKSDKLIAGDNRGHIGVRFKITKFEGEGAKIKMYFIYEHPQEENDFYVATAYSHASGKIKNFDDFEKHVIRIVEGKIETPIKKLRDNYFPDMQFAAIKAVQDKAPENVGKMTMNAVPTTEAEVRVNGLKDFYETITIGKPPTVTSAAKKETTKTESRSSKLRKEVLKEKGGKTSTLDDEDVNIQLNHANNFLANLHLFLSETDPNDLRESLEKYEDLVAATEFMANRIDKQIKEGTRVSKSKENKYADALRKLKSHITSVFGTVEEKEEEEVNPASSGTASGESAFSLISGLDAVIEKFTNGFPNGATLEEKYDQLEQDASLLVGTYENMQDLIDTVEDEMSRQGTTLLKVAFQHNRNEFLNLIATLSDLTGSTKPEGPTSTIELEEDPLLKSMEAKYGKAKPDDGIPFKTIRADENFTDPQTAFSEKVAILSRILPNWVKVEDIERLIATVMEGDVLLGAYLDNVVYLSKLGGNKVAYHEAFHVVFRSIFKDHQVRTLLAHAKNKYAKPTNEDLNRLRDLAISNGRVLTMQQLRDLYYEEKLADDFMEYAYNRDKKVTGWLQRLINTLKKWINMLVGNKNYIEATFSDIYNGNYKHTPSPNTNPIYRSYPPAFMAIKVKDVDGTRLVNNGTFSILSKPEENRIIFGVFNEVVRAAATQANYDPTAPYRIRNEIKAFRERYNPEKWEAELDKYAKSGKNPWTIINRMVKIYRALENEDNIKTIVKDVQTRTKSVDIQGLAESHELDQLEQEAEYNGENDFARFNQALYEVGGVQSLSKVMREYIYTTTNSIDEFGFGLDPSEMKDPKFEVTVNGGMIYNGLLRAMMNTDIENMFNKFRVFSNNNPNTRAFYNKFINDIANQAGLEVSEVEELFSQPKLSEQDIKILRESSTFNLFIASFNKDMLDFMTILFDKGANKDKVSTRTFTSNRTGTDKIQLESWQGQMEALKLDKNEFDKIVDSIQDHYYDKVVVMGKDFNGTDHKSIDSHAKDIQAKFKKLGMDISVGYIKWSLLNFHKDRWMQYEEANPDLYNEYSQFYSVYGNVTPLHIEATPNEVLFTLLRKWNREYPITSENPSGIYSLRLNKKGMGTFSKVAKANALFDESIGESVFRNAEGKQVYAILPPMYLSTVIRRIRESNLSMDDMQPMFDALKMTDPYRQGMLKQVLENSNILKGLNYKKIGEAFQPNSSDEYASFVLQQLNLVIADGIREESIGDNEVIENWKQSNGAKTYKSLGAEAEELFKLALYDDSGSANDDVIGPDGKKVQLRYFLLNNSEKSTQVFIRMPVEDRVVTDMGTPDARLTEYSRTAFYNLFKQEFDRIKKIVSEIEDIKNGTKTDFISNAYHGKSNTHDAMDIVNGKVTNAKMIADGLTTGKYNARGLMFFRYKEHPLAQRMMQAALAGESIEQYETEIKDSFDDIYLPQIQEYIDTVLVPFGAVTKRTVKQGKTINVYWSARENPLNTRILSNLAPREFEWTSTDGETRKYGSVEHAYQTNKTGQFDEEVYERGFDDFVEGKKNAPKVDVEILKGANNLALMQELVVASFVQNKNGAHAKKLLEYENFTHNTNTPIDKAFIEGLYAAQKALGKPETTATEAIYVNNLLPRAFGKKGEQVSMQEMAKFFINHTINVASANQLLHGDLALNYKDFDDFTKRNGGLIAAGPSSTGKIRFKLQSSVEQALESIEKLRHLVQYNKPIDRTDAQNYGNMNLYIDQYLKPNGKYQERVKPLLQRIARGLDLVERLTEDEVDVLDKFNANLHDRKIVGRDMTWYDKTSLHTLTRAETSTINPEFRKNFEGDKAAQIAEMNKRYDALDVAKKSGDVTAIQTAAKAVNKMFVARVGRLSRHLKLNDMNYNNYDLLIYDSALKTAKFDIDSDVVQEVDGEWLREQVNTDGFKNKIPHGTQLMQLIWSEQNPDTVVEWQGKSLPIGELVTKYNELLAERVRRGHVDLKDTIFRFAPDGKLTAEAYNELYKAFENGLITDDLWVTELFTTNAQGQPIFDGNYPAIRYKFESMYLAFVSNRVFKSKTPGRKYTLVSDEGMEVAREFLGSLSEADAIAAIEAGDHDVVEYTEKGQTKWARVGKVVRDVRTVKKAITSRLRHAVKSKDRFGNDVYLSECIVSEKALRKFGLKLGDEIPVDLAIQMGVRIPTQDKHSMVNLKIVDTLPAYYGNSIMLPYEIIALSGADFDIDSLFARMFSTYKTASGYQVAYGNYYTAENPVKAALAEWTFSKGKRLGDISEADFLATEYAGHTMKYWVDYNVTAFKAGRPQDIKPLNDEELNNLLLDIELRLTYNDGNKVEAGTPASMHYFVKMKEEFESLGIKSKNKSRGIDTPLDQNKTSKSLEIGDRGIGVSAVFNTMFQRLKALNVTVGRTLFDKYDKLDSFHTKFNKGKVRKNDVFSAIVSAMTDNAKEKHASEFNLTLDTLGPAMYMLGLGVPVEQVLFLMRQPIISEYISEMNAENSPIQLDERTRKEGLPIQELKAKDRRALAYTLEKFGIDQLATNQPFDIADKQLLADMIKTYEQGGQLSEDQKKMQVYVLKEFVNAKILSEDLRSYRGVSSLLKGMKTTWYQSEDMLRSLNKLGVKFKLKDTASTGVDRGLNLSDWELYQELNDEGLPKNASNIDFVKLMEAFPVDKINALAAKTHIVGSKHYFLLQSRVAQKMKELIELQMQPSYFAYSENHRTLENALIAHLISTAYKNNINSDYNLKKLLSDPTKENELYDNIERLKEMYPNNYFLQMVRFEPISFDKGLYAGNTLHKLSIETNFSADVERQEDLMRGFHEIFNEGQKLRLKNPESMSIEEKTVNDLLMYLVVKDGLLFKNGSFIRAISPYIMQDAFTNLTEMRAVFAGTSSKQIESIFGKGNDIFKLSKDFIQKYSRWASTSYNLKYTPKTPVYSGKDVVIGSEVDEGGVPGARRVVLNMYAGTNNKELTDEQKSKMRERNNKALDKMNIPVIASGKFKNQRAFPRYIKHDKQLHELSHTEVYIKKDKTTLRITQHGKIMWAQTKDKTYLSAAKQKAFLAYLVRAKKLTQTQADNLVLQGIGFKAVYKPINPFGNKEISPFGNSIGDLNAVTPKYEVKKTTKKTEGEVVDVWEKPASTKKETSKLVEFARQQAKTPSEDTQKETNGFLQLKDKLVNAKKGDVLSFDSGIAGGKVYHEFTENMNTGKMSILDLWQRRMWVDTNGNEITENKDQIDYEFVNILRHLKKGGKNLNMDYDSFIEASEINLTKGFLKEGNCK